MISARCNALVSMLMLVSPLGATYALERAVRQHAHAPTPPLQHTRTHAHARSTPARAALRMTLPDCMADRILVFHRGIGSQKMSGLLIDQKLDLLVVRRESWLRGRGCLCGWVLTVAVVVVAG